MIKLILASISKQRKDIFDMLGLKYDVVVSDIEEKCEFTNPEDYVMELSRLKASAVQSKINDKAIIVSADGIIYMDGKIYEKPKNKQEAFNNIKEMSGKITYAYTGVTIKDLYKNQEITFYDMCEVYINELLDEDIKWYVDNEENLLNRCGYVILGKASLFIKKVNGDYNTVFGISPSKVYEKLKELGYKISDFYLR